MNKAIILTENQVWDYMLCPAHFEMARRKIVPETAVTFKSLTDKVTRLFFIELMNGTVPSLDKLKKEWDIICRKNPAVITQKLCIAGYAGIAKMYSWAERNRLRILDCMVPYAILIDGREGQRIDLKGEIPFIGVNQNNKVEILVIDYGEKHTTQVRTDMNLKYTLHCFSYRRQTGHDIGIHVRNIKYDEDTFSFRTEEDYKRMQRTISDIAFSIDKNLFYPREGLGCLSCNVAGACRVWH